MDVCFLSQGSAVCNSILHEIGEKLEEVLHIGDGEVSDKKSSNVDAHGCLEVAPPKCLNKSATFPNSGGLKLPHSFSQEEEEDKPLESALQQLFSEECTNDVYKRSNSFPSALKLVSAMKGSREKRGASAGKLTVTWAPDVYDPPPTSASHFLGRVSKQKASRKDKKNGKRGHKGKDYSRGGGSRDSSKAAGSKKKKRSRPVSTNRCYSLPEDNNPCVVTPKSMGNFEIGCTDTCGSSYFMNSLTRVHYSAAEAL